MADAPDAPPPIVDDDTAGPPGWGPWVATTLAIVAGYVDAVCFSHLFGVFPANQSGNVILAGIAIGDGNWGEFWRPLVAIVAFGFGVGAAVALTDRWDPGPRRRLLVVTELALLVAFTIPAMRVGTTDPPVAGAGSALLLATGALAMGVQTDAVRRVAGSVVATTFQTGAIVRVAEVTARALGGRPAAADRTRTTLVLLTLVLFGYLGGAAVGELIVRHWRGALILPCLVLAGLLVADVVGSGRSPDSPERTRG